MHQWQVAGVGPVDTYGNTNLGSSRGTQVSAGNAVASKGAWVVVASATLATYESLMLTVAGLNAANYLVDLGVGSPNGVRIIQENIPMPSLKAALNYAQPYNLPLHVPMSTQILARCQSSNSAAAIYATLHGMSQNLGGAPGYAKGLAWGVSSAVSRGTTLDAGATANTKAALTIIQSVVVDSWEAMAVCFGNAADIARANCSFLVDIFVSSRAIISEMLVMGGTDADVPIPFYVPPFMVTVKSGDIISGRVQCTSTTAGDRALDVLLLGYR